jgi:hypothetical protein
VLTRFSRPLWSGGSVPGGLQETGDFPFANLGCLLDEQMKSFVYAYNKASRGIKGLSDACLWGISWTSRSAPCKSLFPVRHGRSAHTLQFCQQKLTPIHLFQQTNIEIFGEAQPLIIWSTAEKLRCVCGWMRQIQGKTSLREEPIIQQLEALKELLLALRFDLLSCCILA